MGKHKYGKHSSSSSSSSSDSSDDDWKHLPKHEKKQRKKWKKQIRKGRLPPGSVPPWGGAPYYHSGKKHGGRHYGAPGAMHYGAPHGVPHGVPGAYPAHGAYPAQPYPGAHAPPQPAYPPAAYGAPGQQPYTGGYPGAYPAGQGPPPPAPPGGYPAPGYGPGGFAQPGTGYPAHVDQPPIQPGAASYPAQVAGAPAPAPPPGQPAAASAPGLPPASLAAGPGTTGTMMPSGQPPPAGGVQAVGDQLQRIQLDGSAELFRPTVRPAPNFSAERDCEALRHAMKGAGTDERTIIGIVSQRSNAQRQDIAKFYKTMFGRDIIADLESELSGNFRETIMALFKDPAFYDAWSLNQAMEGAGTKESVLIEILCTRTNQQIRDIVACYKQHFHRDLEKDIADDTSGHFKKLLISCCQGNRQELTPQQIQLIRTQGPAAVVDVNLARQDAQKLQEAGVKRMGTDESAFITVLALRHMYQLQATFAEYEKLTGKDLLSAIASETSGDFETGLRAVVRTMKNRPEYFADKLHDSIKFLGTDDSRLIRIIVSRSEIDLQDIKDFYLTKYKKTLESDVASDTSGDYKRLLVALVGL